MIELTTLHLQESLCREIEDVVKDMLLKNPLGQEVKLRAFKQQIPIERIEGKNLEEEDDVTDPFPYCVVRVEDGSMGEKNTVNTNLLIGLFHDDADRQGHVQILTIIHRIYYRFAVNPVLDHRYRQDGEIKWALDGPEENTHPYYFGGMSISWQVPKIEREDELA